jgi:hypothetical protein
MIHAGVHKEGKLKWGRSMTQEAELLLCKPEALSSNPSPITHQRERERERENRELIKEAIN